MSDTPELDQVADARRRIAVHAEFPVAYWAIYGVALVFMAGFPIWSSWLTRAELPYLSWVLTAVCIASAIYTVLRRHRSGVHLPKRIGAYPGARPIWLVGLAIALAGFVGIHQLVNREHEGLALCVLPVVAVAVFVTQVKTRSAMRRDIETGRVRP